MVSQISFIIHLFLTSLGAELLLNLLNSTSSRLTEFFSRTVYPCVLFLQEGLEHDIEHTCPYLSVFK
jgi:hypothetical protein